MAPPPPMPMSNGNLSNGIVKPANIITPQTNNHAGLLKQIESGEFLSFYDDFEILIVTFFLGVSLRKVEPHANRVPSGGYGQGDLMREIRDGE